MNRPRPRSSMRGAPTAIVTIFLRLYFVIAFFIVASSSHVDVARVGGLGGSTSGGIDAMITTMSRRIRIRHRTRAIRPLFLPPYRRCFGSICYGVNGVGTTTMAFAHRSSSSSVCTSSTSTSHRRYPFIDDRDFANTSHRAMRPPRSSSAVSSSSSWTDEERGAYDELYALSAKMRALDDVYYGGKGDPSMTVVGDDEYDALARREEALCLAYPGLLTRLEDETGLGVMATRFGGRVGRTYGDIRDEGGVDDDDGQHDAIGVGGGENDHESDSGMVKKTNVSKSTKSLRSGGGRRIKRRHLPNAPMLSLDNAMDDDEALAWLNRMRRLILSSSPIAKEEEEDDDGVIGDSEFSIASTTTTTRATRTMRILAEPKIDGLGLSLRYVLDKSRSSLGVDDVYDFAWGATRGDGTRGEDVTEAVRSSWMTGGTDDEEEDADVDGEKDLAAAHERVDEPADEDDRSFSVPRTLAIPRGVGGLGRIDSPPPDAIEIRGEVVLPRRAFEEFVGSDGGDDGRMDEASSSGKSLRTTAFSNARNAASGILLRSRDPPDSADAIRTKFLRSRLQFYAYDLVASSASLSSSSLASSLDEGGEKEDASNDSSSLSWPSTVMGDDGLQMRDALTRLGFHVPSPIAMESIDVAPDVELNIADVPNLLNYHRNLMVNREGGDDDDDEATRYDDKARVREANDSTTRTAFPYQIDGVVYKLSSFDDRRICGSSSRAPRWAMAHKFPPTRAVTRLLDIEVQVGRTGSLTPVAILEPVYINGVSVSRATLHNFHHARKLLLPNRATDHISVDIGLVSKSIGVKKGISLLVGRAGDVIPQVKKRVFDDELDDSVESANETITLEDPLVCPACGSSTSFDFVRVPMKGRGVNSKSEENDETLKIISNDEEGVVNPKGGQVLRCSGPQLLCQPRAVNGLVHAYSRAGLNVNGLSKARISHLMEEGIIRFPSDLFALYGGTKGKASSERDDATNRIVSLPGWGKLSSQNLADSVRSVASTGVPLSRFIYSLGIPQIGTHASQLVASVYGNVESFLKAVEEASHCNTDVSNIDEVGIENPMPPFPALTGWDGFDKVKGIGPTAIASLVAFSREQVLVNEAKELASVLTIHDNRSRNTSDANTSDRHAEGSQKQKPFDGMTVVFTGALPGMSREMAQNAAKDLGAKATPTAVSKATSLVVDGKEGTSNKARKARELGIRVIDYTEFMRLIDASN